jgi:hypothetical protein
MTSVAGARRIREEKRRKTKKEKRRKKKGLGGVRSQEPTLC